MKLIVGVEETEESRDALRLARLFAEAEGGELHVVVVLPFDTSSVVPDEYEKMRDRHFESVLAIASDELFDDYTEHRLDGVSAAAGLTTVAEDLGADAIIIGSSHHGAIGRVFMGDVGAALSAGAPCAVVAAPRGFARRKEPRFDRIGVGYDATPESETALSAGAGLARQLDTSLRLIGVVPRVLTAGRISGTDSGYERLLCDEMQKRLDAAAEVSGVDEVSCELRVGFGPADELAEASEDLDLLVVGSRGYGPLRRVLLGSVSLKLMRSSACPVVVMPRASRKGPVKRMPLATLAPFAL